MNVFQKLSEMWTGLSPEEAEQVQLLSLPTSQVTRTAFEYALDEEFLEESPETAIPRLLDSLNDATPEEAEEIQHMLKILGYPKRNPQNDSLALRSDPRGSQSKLAADGDTFQVGDIVKDYQGDVGEIVDIIDSEGIPEYKIFYPGTDDFGEELWAWMEADEIDHTDEEPEEEDPYPEIEFVPIGYPRLATEPCKFWLFGDGTIKAWKYHQGKPHHGQVLMLMGYAEMDEGDYWGNDGVIARDDHLQESGAFIGVTGNNTMNIMGYNEPTPEQVESFALMVAPLGKVEYVSFETDENYKGFDSGEEFLEFLIQTKTASLEEMSDFDFRGYEMAYAVITENNVYGWGSEETGSFAWGLADVIQNEGWGNPYQNYPELKEIENLDYGSEDYDVEYEHLSDLAQNFENQFYEIVIGNGAILGLYDEFEVPKIEFSNVMPGESDFVTEKIQWLLGKLENSGANNLAGDLVVKGLENLSQSVEDAYELYGDDTSVTDILYAIQGDKVDIEDVVLNSPPDPSTVPFECKYLYDSKTGELYVWSVADLYGIQGWPHHAHVIEWLGYEGIEPTHFGHAKPNGLLDIFEEDYSAGPDEAVQIAAEFSGFCSEVSYSGDRMSLQDFLDMWGYEEEPVERLGRRKEAISIEDAIAQEEAPVFTPEQRQTISEIVQEIGPENISSVISEDANGEYILEDFVKTSATIKEDGTVGFQGEDIGNKHKFILTPDGEFYAWGKKDFDYGKGFLAIENEGTMYDELDDFTRYEWEMDASDTYDFYRNQGYATGQTSSGAFFMLNAPSGLNEAQVEALENVLREQGYRSIVIHEQGTRNHFSQGKDALDWLSPRRNPEREELEYPNFFEGKPEEDLMFGNRMKEAAGEKSDRDHIPEETIFLISPEGKVAYGIGEQVHPDLLWYNFGISRMLDASDFVRGFWNEEELVAVPMVPSMLGEEVTPTPQQHEKLLEIIRGVPIDYVYIEFPDYFFEGRPEEDLMFGSRVKEASTPRGKHYKFLIVNGELIGPWQGNLSHHPDVLGEYLNLPNETGIEGDYDFNAVPEETKIVAGEINDPENGMRDIENEGWLVDAFPFGGTEELTSEEMEVIKDMVSEANYLIWNFDTTISLDSVSNNKMKEAMAQQTGNQTLDFLIEKFLSKNPAIYQDPDYKRRWLKQLTNPDYAWGSCTDVSNKFKEFLNENGIDAETTFATDQEHPDTIGYEDRSVKGDDYHCVVMVDLEEKVYMIDWSASQYGYEEFPMVQKLNEDGWEREFGNEIKEAMAQRSEDPNLNFLIEEFLSESIDLEGDGNLVPVKNLSDGNLSMDHCADVSIYFCHFLRDKGYPHEFDLDQNKNHTWVTVETDEETYSVDWTATQFGDYDFPQVQLLSKDQPSDFPDEISAWYNYGVDPQDYKDFVQHEGENLELFIEEYVDK